MAITNLGDGELHVLKDTGVANGAIEGQVAVVLTTGPNIYDQASSANAPINGVALEDGLDTELFTLVKSGFMVVLAGATTAEGLELAVDGAGKFVAAVGAATHVVGISKTAALGVDDEMLIELFQSGYKLP